MWCKRCDNNKEARDAAAAQVIAARKAVRARAAVKDTGGTEDAARREILKRIRATGEYKARSAPEFRQGRLCGAAQTLAQEPVAARAAQERRRV